MKHLIEEAIKQHTPLVFEYVNKEGLCSIHELCNINYYKGKEYIRGNNMLIGKDLTFKISRITKILDENSAERELNIALSKQGIIEIEYLKNGCKRYHIDDLRKEYLNIEAYCWEMKSRSTFHIPKIKSVNWIWRDIYEREEITQQSGLYLFACRCDNHLEFELYQLQKDDLLWKYYIGDFGHCDGYFSVIPLACHYIDINLFDRDLSEVNNNITRLSELNYISVFEYERMGMKEYALGYDGKPQWPERCFYDYKFDLPQTYFEGIRNVKELRVMKYSERNHLCHLDSNYMRTINKKSNDK